MRQLRSQTIERCGRGILRLSFLARPALCRVLVFCMIAVFCAGMQASAMDMSEIVDLEMSVTGDSDVNAAFLPEDQRSDSALTLHITAGKRAQINEFSNVALTLDMTTQEYRQYTGLNNLAAGLTLSWVKVLGLGPEAPRLRVFGSAVRRDFKDSVRDGSDYRAGLALTKRVTPHLDVAAAFSIQSITSSGKGLFDHHGEEEDEEDAGAEKIKVFNGNGYTTGVTLGYVFPRDMRLVVAWWQRRGDVVWHRSAEDPPDPYMPENTFNMEAYRLPSRTRTLAVMFCIPTGLRTMVYAGLERRQTVWSYESYPNDIYIFGLTHRMH